MFSIAFLILRFETNVLFWFYFSGSFPVQFKWFYKQEKRRKNDWNDDFLAQKTIVIIFYFISLILFYFVLFCFCTGKDSVMFADKIDLIQFLAAIN